ncbi:MAG TPA: DUF2339 domain-containing protein, partial [Candidatus Acidoferrales bacterium]|nr:DUF2339 domain-containing protein [Candidatus Acidoferrales bacterium]
MPFWIFLLAVWIFAEWMMRRSDRRRNDQRFSNVINTLNIAEKEFRELKQLTTRVAALEKQVASLKAEHQQAPPVEVGAAFSATPAPKSEAPQRDEPSVPAPTQTVAPAPVHVPHATPVPSAPAVPPPTAVPPGAAIPAMPPHAIPSGAQSPKSGGVATGVTPHPATAGAPGAPHAAAPTARREIHDIEQMLGTNWLNKIGIAVLVIGIALFLAYKFPTLSNAEKVGLGYIVSFGILALGIFLERKDVYRIFARALIGGGWALVFFTTYAMHFVTYTRVIDTEWIDLVLLFAVAWAMVVHTLHYNSQVVTGLAFLLGFTTVAISENTVYCLTAGAILAFGIVTIVHKRSWFELEIFGLLASYVNHYVWLRTVIGPMGTHRHMFPEFLPSAALLCTYWALYRWSYIARRIQREAQEHISTLAALLNTGFLLFLLKYQSVQPNLAFYVLLALGAIELTLGQLPVTRKRRTAAVILSTIGIVLLVAAVPFKYSGMGTAILWLAQAETLIIAGVLTRETLFRRFGFLAAVLTVGDLLLAGAAPVFETRMAQPDMLHAAPEYRIAVTFLFAGLLFLVDAEWIPRNWADAIGSEFEAALFRAISYLGGFAAFVGLWLAFPNLWTAVAWTAAAAIFATAGRAANAKDLSHQANWIAVAGFFAALFVNVDTASNVWLPSNILAAISPELFPRLAHGPFHFDLPFITTVLVIALLYACAYFSGPKETIAGRFFSAIHSWAAMILLLSLTLQEAAFPWVSVIWAVFGVLLLIAATQLRRSEFAFQSVIVSAFAVVLTLTINLFASEPFGLIPSLSLRLVTMTLTTACLYFSAWWARLAESIAEAAAAYTWAGSFLVWMLLLYELQPLHVAFAWVLLGLALFECGIFFRSLNLRLQGYVVFASALIRVFLVNIDASPHDLAVTTLPLAVVFYYVHWRAEMKREDLLGEDKNFLAAQFLSYFGTITVATVLYFGLDAGWVGAGWAAMALVLIAVAWTAKHDILLHHSLLLAMAVLLRAIFFDLPEPLIHGVPVMQNRSFHVIAASAALFGCMAFAFPLRRRFAARTEPRGFVHSLPFVQRPEQVFFFIPLAMVTALLARDVTQGRVTMAWGIEAVLVFSFALLVGERSFRLTGLGLLLLCVGKILLLDVWRQNKSDRFTTFIILGIALLLVSFL